METEEQIRQREVKEATDRLNAEDADRHRVRDEKHAQKQRSRIRHQPTRRGQ